jgi:hypothetical protein
MQMRHGEFKRSKDANIEGGKLVVELNPLTSGLRQHCLISSLSMDLLQGIRSTGTSSENATFHEPGHVFLPYLVCYR